MIETPKIGDASLVYMYGLSDFWVDMFADSSLVESLLEGETVQLAEAYSYFIQRSAGISLEDIQEKYQTRIKLLLVGEEDLVNPLDLSEFRVDESIISTRHLTNRPILGSSTLDNDVHYEIRDNILKLHKPIDELAFPIRYRADGTWQYAIWMCDVEINEKWIDNSFGRLVGFTEEDAIFNYKSFLEGVYFLYANGPNLSFIERGVNLAMGMPYAREAEDVLAIEQDALSGNWIVFTAHNSYEIPYGYRPELSVGNRLEINQVLSTWVEVRDYQTDGAWWYQIYLPREVLNLDPSEPTTSIGKAERGSVGDLMMENFLKHHMFEVLITQPNGDITAFNTARELVLRAKPEYTYPVFLWKVPLEDEIINMDDEFGFSYSNNQFNAEYCVAPPPVRYMDRSSDDTNFLRGTNRYNRCQGSMYAASLIGYGDWPDNGGWAPQFDSITPAYEEYMALLMRNRGDKVSPTSRGTVMRGWRGAISENNDGITWEIPADSVYGNGGEDYQVDERILTPLYMMSREEMTEKMRTVAPRFQIEGRTRFIVTGLNLPDVYDTWMKRNDLISVAQGSDYQFPFSQGGLDIAFSYFAYQTYLPDRDDMYDRDGLPILNGTLMITRSTDSSWACQWVRNDFAYAPTMFPLEDNDWTRAIEEYQLDDIGEEDIHSSRAFNAEVLRVQTPSLSEFTIGGTEQYLVTVDGKYVPQDQYRIETDNAMAENTEDPANPTDLGILSRSYLVVDEAPIERGYITDTSYSTYMTNEERIVNTGVVTLSESVANREEILVINEDTGEFIMDYLVVGDQLTVSDLSVANLIVRYVDMRDEEILNPGNSQYTLSLDEHCTLFRAGKIIEEWSFRRIGARITLAEVATDPITVRYYDRNDDIKVSPFNRSTVESNQARFLMDRSREGGQYDDYLGNTVYMNRSGIPTLADGSDADSVNVIRRLL